MCFRSKKRDRYERRSYLITNNMMRKKKILNICHITNGLMHTQNDLRYDLKTIHEGVTLARNC